MGGFSSLGSQQARVCAIDGDVCEYVVFVESRRRWDGAPLPRSDQRGIVCCWFRRRDRHQLCRSLHLQPSDGNLSIGHHVGHIRHLLPLIESRHVEF